MGIVEINIKVPSWNACYRISHSRIFKTSEAKSFQEIVGYSYKGDYHDGDVEVFVEFHRAPLIDLDNCCKMLLDSLEGIAYKRDRQVRRLTVESHKCKKGEDRLYISVEELNRSEGQ